jgi:hypothetical protein
MSINSAIPSSAVVLSSFYLLGLLAATPFAYMGIGWLGASERGWRTQVAAGALIAGWLALAFGAAFVWRFVRTRQRSYLLLGLASGVVAVAAYAVTYEWGGRMLI